MKTSTFVRGLVICLVLMIAGGFGLAALSHGRSRPEGVAENWLTDISDTTRQGVEADARKRAAKLGGGLDGAKGLVWPDAKAIGRKAAFDDLEVGKAVAVPNDPYGVRLAFRVHARRPGDKTVVIEGVIYVEQGDDNLGWGVLRVKVGDPVRLGVPKLPSDGGPPPSSAPISLWIGGLVVAAIIGVVTSLLVRMAGRPAPVAATA